jgi:hypothetical protein
MRGIIWLLFTTLLTTLVFSGPARSQNIDLLVGRWVATVPAQADAIITRDGKPIRFIGRPAYTATLSFKADNHGFLQWGDSAKAQVFTYRLVNSKLIEMQYPGRKPWRHTFAITGGKLSLSEYPIPEKPQEQILILYTLDFTKQP